MHVIIPNKNDFFSLYADGIVIDKYKKNKHLVLEFLASDAIVLFYTYPTSRRAYIVWQKGRYKTRLPNVLDPVGIIYKFYGRKIDVLKNTLFFLKRSENIKSNFLPPCFFRELAVLIDCKKLTQSTRMALLQKHRLV